MDQYKEWAVDLIVTTEHRYFVPARTAEEAISTAEELLDSGDEGQILATDVETADAVTGDTTLDEEDIEP